jgi:hypothetical protein
MQGSKDELTRERIDALRVELKPAERILQIIHLNFLVGASVLFGIFYFVSTNIVGNDGAVPVVFLFVAVLVAVLSFFVPGLIRGMRPSPDQRTEGQLTTVYHVSHIIGSIMLEAGIIFSSFAFRIASEVPQWFVFVPAFLILVLLLRFPLPGKMTDWVIEQLESRRG